eukprot:364577-Chlamydomonas_euryale.AAC.19
METSCMPTWQAETGQSMLRHTCACKGILQSKPQRMRTAHAPCLAHPSWSMPLEPAPFPPSLIPPSPSLTS